ELAQIAQLASDETVDLPDRRKLASQLFASSGFLAVTVAAGGQELYAERRGPGVEGLADASCAPPNGGLEVRDRTVAAWHTGGGRAAGGGTGPPAGERGWIAGERRRGPGIGAALRREPRRRARAPDPRSLRATAPLPGRRRRSRQRPLHPARLPQAQGGRPGN